MADNEGKYFIHKKWLMVLLENEINELNRKEKKAKEDEDYAEALEYQIKSETITSIISRHLV